MRNLEGKNGFSCEGSPLSWGALMEASEPSPSLRRVRTIVLVPPSEKQEFGPESAEWSKQQGKSQRRWENELQWERSGGEGEKIKGEEGEEQGQSAEGPRVNKKTNKKGKRDGENIRTYARYDSLIQTLEEELAIHRIYTKTIDQNLIDHFDMKSKRSLERYFFYLCLAKRQGRLTAIIPALRLKTKKKVIEKGGHRTNEFLETLQGCIECYIVAAELLDAAGNEREAKGAFKHAYLYDENQSTRLKRPHHNQVKGIEKCMQIYHEIIEQQATPCWDHLRTLPEQEDLGATWQVSKQLELNPVRTSDPDHSLVLMGSLQDDPSPKKTQPSALIHGLESSIEKEEEGENSMRDGQGEELLKGKKKLSGLKNKKQDDRDIQKYAKFDIVSESSLEFCKQHRIHRLILENTRKLSQRSLHFFFVILAVIQREGLQPEFITHLEHDHDTKVERRYTQRSPYFREQLKKSFRNLVDSSKILFDGDLEAALKKAYEVCAEKRTHPAKANQLAKCKEIYQDSIQGMRSQVHNDK